MSRGGLAALAVWLLAATASARTISVEGVGCEAPDDLDAILTLELAGADWELVASGGEIRVELETCDEARWVARLFGAAGPLRAPVELEVEALPARSRTRVAALWLAEWLATVVPESRRAEERPREVRPGPALPAWERPALRIRALALGVVRHHEDSPVTLGGGELHLQLARTGLPIVAFELGLGVEGGSRWGVPVMALSGSLGALAAVFVVPDWIELSAGARFALRYLVDYGFGQVGGTEVSSPWHTTASGFVRATMFLDRGIAAVVEVEIGGAISPAITSTTRVVEGPHIDALFDGLLLAARAGLAIE